MKAWVTGVRYIPAENDSYIDSGYKRGQYPKYGYYRGGNGTFRVFCGTPADIKVYADAETGQRLTFSIGADVRRIGGYTRLTYGRGQRFVNAQPYEIELVRQGHCWAIAEQDLVDWMSRAR